jgi:hypothetical protein
MSVGRVIDRLWATEGQTSYRTSGPEGCQRLQLLEWAVPKDEAVHTFLDLKRLIMVDMGPTGMRR